MIITLADLRAGDACADAVKTFEETFGARIEFTPALRKRVAELAPIFDWGWAARYLLSPAARRAYYEAVAPARRAYDEARALAFLNCALNVHPKETGQ